MREGHFGCWFLFVGDESHRVSMEGHLRSYVVFFENELHDRAENIVYVEVILLDS